MKKIHGIFFSNLPNRPGLGRSARSNWKEYKHSTSRVARGISWIVQTVCLRLQNSHSTWNVKLKSFMSMRIWKVMTRTRVRRAQVSRVLAKAMTLYSQLEQALFILHGTTGLWNWRNKVCGLLRKLSKTPSLQARAHYDKLLQKTSNSLSRNVRKKLLAGAGEMSLALLVKPLRYFGIMRILASLTCLMTKAGKCNSPHGTHHFDGAMGVVSKNREVRRGALWSPFVNI